MKKIKDMFNDGDFVEKILGGVFGIIAIIAAVTEMGLNGFTTEAVVGAIKDIASTLVVVAVLIAFVNEHKKVKGIRGTIEKEMEIIENSYAPLIREAIVSENAGDAKKAKLDKVIRYEIAANVEALFGTQCRLYSPFFDINAENPQQIVFYIRKTFFKNTDEKPFDAESIATHIESYMKKRFLDYEMQFAPDSSGGKFIISFPEPLKYENDIKNLINIVDDMTFIYVALKRN